MDWEPLTEVEVSDRGLKADPSKKALLSAATKVDHLSSAIGTRLEGIDLRQLSDTQKDELWVPRSSYIVPNAPRSNTSLKGRYWWLKGA